MNVERFNEMKRKKEEYLITTSHATFSRKSSDSKVASLNVTPPRAHLQVRARRVHTKSRLRALVIFPRITNEEARDAPTYTRAARGSIIIRGAPRASLAARMLIRRQRAGGQFPGRIPCVRPPPLPSLSLSLSLARALCPRALNSISPISFPVGFFSSHFRIMCA